MPALTRNEIRKRLSAFSQQWKNASRENADSKLFWARFYECFGIRPESATIYEKSVAKLGGKLGFIDSFIPGKLIVEHKSKGQSLDRAFEQATDYFIALPEVERPRYIITSDFARFRLYDLRADTMHECTLAGLSEKAQWFSFLLEDNAPEIVEESPVNRNAAYAISRLHEALLRTNFKGRDLEAFLTRLLFCLFADDTGIFGEDGIFRRLVKNSRPDGKDLGPMLSELFDVLNQPDDQRQSTLDEALKAFSYINGKLFAERLGTPAFDSDLRESLMGCLTLDWGGISPAIFGAMFQGVLDAHAPDERRQATRRELGAHYTSERNILRVVNPLCMDDLRRELEASRRSQPRLKALYDRLPALNFLDPACGCGNFLVIAYRELRRIENEVIAELFNFDRGRGLLDVSTLCRVKVSQFFGIEIDESATHIARVAMWITDHQMNLEAGRRFGTTRATVPLVDSPTIICKNALQIDWASVLPPEGCSFVLGNPPFVGKAYQNADQRSDMERVFVTVKNAGLLDYVAAWYVKATNYIQSNPAARVAFVSTNSLTQGEQVPVLWPYLRSKGIDIHFAHRTFQWNNEGKGNAAVHCVIIGFGLQAPVKHTIFDYSADIKGEGQSIPAKHINPYLVDAPDVVLANRRAPICAVPEMVFGSMPNDGGNLLLSDAEKEFLITAEPKAEKWVRPFLGADEFINNLRRWVLWLVGIPPAELRTMPEVYKRVQAVKAMRLASKRATTQQIASTPYLFGEIRQPSGDYLLVPSVSSERRKYIPIGFISPTIIASNLVLTISNAGLFHFSVLNSTMHNAWMRAVCGRLESRYRYSASIVYNNYPWPQNVTDKQRAIIESAGQAVLDARALHPGSSLADLYDPLTMPPELLKAHQEVDRVVDAAYGYRGDKADAPRVSFLFGLYQQLTSLLPQAGKRKKRAG
jgi:hypothetical protein